MKPAASWPPICSVSEWLYSIGPGPVRALPLGVGQIEGGERKPVAYYQFAPLLQCRDVEYEDVRVHEPGHQDSARAQHAERFPPDRCEIGAEHIGHRVEDDIEAGIGEHAQVAHVAKHGADGEFLAGGHLPVAAQLPRRVVKHGHCDTQS